MARGNFDGRAFVSARCPSLLTAPVQGIRHWKNQWGRRSLMSWRSCSGHRRHFKDQRHFGETTPWPIKMEIRLWSSESNHRKCEVADAQNCSMALQALTTCVSPKWVVGGSWTWCDADADVPCRRGHRETRCGSHCWPLLANGDDIHPPRWASDALIWQLRLTWDVTFKRSPPFST